MFFSIGLRNSSLDSSTYNSPMKIDIHRFAVLLFASAFFACEQYTPIPGRDQTSPYDIRCQTYPCTVTIAEVDSQLNFHRIVNETLSVASNPISNTASFNLDLEADQRHDLGIYLFYSYIQRPGGEFSNSSSASVKSLHSDITFFSTVHTDSLANYSGLGPVQVKNYNAQTNYPPGMIIS